MEKIKRIALQTMVLFINAILVVGGVFFIKNSQEKVATEKTATDADATGETPIDPVQQEYIDKAAQLGEIIQKSGQQKTESIANNPPQVTRQVPTTVTQTIPGKTTTVKVPSGSSSSGSSSTSSTPKTTTKKS